MAELAGVAFVFDKAFEAVKHMAELGENTTNMAATVGLSVEEYSKLDRQLGLVGKSGETAARSLIILQTKIEEAVNKPESKARSSFDAMGITPEELREWSTTADGAMHALLRMAEVEHQFADGTNKTTAERNLLGRSMKEIIPWLKEQEELEARVSANKSAFTAPEAKSWKDVQLEINTLSDAFFGLEKAVLTGLTSPLEHALTSMTSLVREVTDLSNKIPSISPFVAALISPGGALALPALAGHAIGGAASSALGLGGSEPATGRQPDGSVIVPVPGGGATGTHASPRENFAHFNYGNIKAAGGQWNEYAGPEEGTQAMADWLVRSQEQHGTDTLGKIIERYSPESDNRGKHLPQAASAATGLDLNQIIDVHDESIRQKIVQALLKQEGAPSAAFATRAAGGGGEMPQMGAVIDWAAQKKDLDADLKNITHLMDLDKEFYARKIVLAKGNESEIRKIEGERDAKLKADMEEWVQINAAADKRIQSDPKSQELSLYKLGTEEIKRRQTAEEVAAASKIKGLEAERKVADIRETSALEEIEGRRRTGDLSVGAAEAAELRIVEIHKAAVDRILADEMRAAGEIEKLATQVADRKIVEDEKYEAQKKKIEIKAGVEEAQRAAAIDKQIASTAAQSIVGIAWGKSTPGQALASTAQSLETKALEKVGEKLLDSAGVGKMLDKLGESILGVIPEQLTLGTSSLTTASQIAALGTAAAAAATQMGGSSAASGAGGLLGKLPFGSLLGGGAAAGAEGFSAVEVVEALPLAFLGGGGIIPSAAGGMVNDGKGGRLIVAHPNEMVLPQYLSEGVQGMIAKGGAAAGGPSQGFALHYAPQINAPESPDLKQLLQRHGNDMLYWLQAQHRSGAYRIPD